MTVYSDTVIETNERLPRKYDYKHSPKQIFEVN